MTGKKNTLLFLCMPVCSFQDRTQIVLQVALWDFPSSKYFFIQYLLLQTSQTKWGQNSNVVFANAPVNTNQELQQGKW